MEFSPAITPFAFAILAFMSFVQSLFHVNKLPKYTNSVTWTKSILVTIPKKGDLTLCKNYRTIALINHMGKVLMTILLSRLKAKTEVYMSDEQAGFRKDRSTVQQILMLRLIAEKAKRKNKPVYNCFVDFQKAFDSIKHDVTWAVLKSYGVGNRLI